MSTIFKNVFIQNIKNLPKILNIKTYQKLDKNDKTWYIQHWRLFQNRFTNDLWFPKNAK